MRRDDLANARAIRERVHGADHVRLGEIERAEGDAAEAGGRLEAAREHYDRAAALDPRLEVIARRTAAGLVVDPSHIAPLEAEEEISIDRAGALAARVRALVTRDREVAVREARALLSRAPPSAGVAATRSIQVGAALLAVGDREEAAQVYRAALAELADEPSRTRLQALIGLARSAVAEEARTAALAGLRMLDALTELDRRPRSELERLAK